MSQLTRALVIASTVLAAFAQTYLATFYWPPQTIWIASASVIVLAIAGDRLRAFVLPAVLASIYFMPAFLYVTRGGETFVLDFLWTMPLLGLALSGPGAQRWSLPERWQWPLITWACIVSISWPIVFLRETDFSLGLLSESVSNTSIGVAPSNVNEFVTYLAVAHNFGILWVDALCRWYRQDQERFVREVVYPLAITATIASLVAIYQGFVDMTFLNRGFWTYMLRVAGTHGDPNKLGAIAGLWTIGIVVLARGCSPRWRMVVSIASIVIGISAVWTSGSRTGLAIVGLSMAIAAFEFGRAEQFNAKGLARFGAVAAALGAVVVIALQYASTHTVIQRGTLGYVPFIGDKGIVKSTNELLWERFGYGPAAIEMVKDHPIEGVGVGMFHALVHDFGSLLGYDIAPDNAQSWLRHIIAELGLLGSVPVLWWCVVFGMMMFARTGPAVDRLAVGLLRGILIGFFVASLFGMPAQAAAVVITFWVFAFWLLLERADEPAAIAAGAWKRPAAIAAALLIAIHAGATLVSARGDLLPRHRAQRFGWAYQYGISELEPDPGGNPLQRRWTGEHAVVVIPVKGKVLKFVAWIDHPDGDANPPHVVVRADSRVIHDGPLKRSAPLFIDIPATPGKMHMVIETSIDRLYRPSDLGSRDRRELGLSIRDFVWE
ncbi:MAG TPA: hypothetical protein VFZ38_19215 [Vicinamibacterales bacterium]